MELSDEDRETLQTVDQFIVEAVAELELAEDDQIADMQVKWDALFVKLMYPLPQ